MLDGIYLRDLTPSCFVGIPVSDESPHDLPLARNWVNPIQFLALKRHVRLVAIDTVLF